ncbi:MAG: hypothetical protein IKX85_01725, partial [Clostridia bacterium]|nr:hypothetical protein [Clostridia bacterium]
MTDMTESAEVKKNAPYDGSDLLYGILSIVFGFLFLKGITSGGAENLGVGMTLLTVFYVISVFIYRTLSRGDASGRRVSWGETVLFAAMILLLGGTYAFTTGVGMKATSLILEVVLILYWVFVLFGNRKENRLDGAAFADSLTAFLIMPFASFLTLFGALFRKRGKRNSGTLGSVLLGLAIAIIPTTVVFLLLSGD